MHHLSCLVTLSECWGLCQALLIPTFAFATLNRRIAVHLPTEDQLNEVCSVPSNPGGGWCKWVLVVFNSVAFPQFN